MSDYKKSMTPERIAKALEVLKYMSLHAIPKGKTEPRQCAKGLGWTEQEFRSAMNDLNKLDHNDMQELDIQVQN